MIEEAAREIAVEEYSEVDVEAFKEGALWMQKAMLEKCAEGFEEFWIKERGPGDEVFNVTADSIQMKRWEKEAYQAAKLSAMSEMKSSNDDTNSTIASLKSDLEWALSKNHNYDRVQEIKKKWGLE